MRFLYLAIIALLLASCATVKKNGYYQTRRYSYGKHIIKQIPGKNKRSNQTVQTVALPKTSLSAIQWDPSFEYASLTLPPYPIRQIETSPDPLPEFLDTDRLIRLMREGKIQEAMETVTPLVNDQKNVSFTALIIIGVLLLLLGLLLILIDYSGRAVQKSGILTVATLGVVPPEDRPPGPAFFFGVLMVIAGLAMTIIGIVRSANGY